ncbi:hypothetical protein DK842_00070 [Chromobacterium phragmitis]|uniref:Uncharacterized protein n=1 Tax=Chromobacterium phragmitis TaxID=2202141 RepID=A0ABV0J0E9_9NEIS|nr:hypothetical protein [Chromobacterium phragmitis]AXE28466.1 hypothetical protein DK842_00070 [Chromobacterium phragmitis]
MDEEEDVSVPEQWAVENEEQIASSSPPPGLADAIWYRLHGLLPTHILVERALAMSHESLLSLCEWACAHPQSMLFRKLRRVPERMDEWRRSLMAQGER